MKHYALIVALVATIILSVSALNGVAQEGNYHTGAGADLAQCDKDIAETQKQKVDADAAALAARKEEAAAIKQVNALRAQKIKATTPEAKKEFDRDIDKAQGDADTAKAEAQKLEAVARERLLHEAQLQFDRIKYAQKAKKEEDALKERKEADKLNEKKRKRADKP